MVERDNNDINKDVPPWLQPVPEDEGLGRGAAIGRKTMMMIGVAFIVVAVFIGAIFFLYADSEPVGSRHIVADNSPIRERPADPGGLPVDHQDKAVLEIGDGSPATASVQIGAQPEQPVQEIPDLPEEPVSAAADAVADTIGDIAEAALDRETEPVSAPRQESRPVETAPTQSTPVQTAPAQPATQVPEPVQQSAQPAGQYAVQLGAYGSEQTAERAWNTIRNKFSRELDGLSPIYIPVQSGDRTLYRLRVGMLAARSDADAVCIALRAQQQACFAVNP